MLRFLRIRNLAVIEAVDVEFGPGFTVLTGETGAGKSILVEAVGLLLGARSSAELVRTGEAQATIEAVFETADERELIVRREITSQGRSRSYVNGVLATASSLRDLSRRLVELHGQHAHQSLLDPLAHLPLLDVYADLEREASAVAAAWNLVREIRERLDRSRMDARERTARLELITFQLGEIEKVAPLAGEDDELSAVQRVLASAERVRALCQESYASLYENDAAVLSQLSGVWKRVDELATMDPRFAPFVETRDSIKSQLEDLSFFLRDYAQDIDASPERLREVDERLAAIERLKRKYGPSLDDVREKGEALHRERALLGGSESGDLEAELERAIAAFLAVARDLSSRRRAAAVGFASDVEGLLGELAMTGARFEVRFEPHSSDAWSARGIDHAEFFLSPNPGEDLRPLARIASGGELSRMMLALKTLAAEDQPGKTLIFDEVDAGIGGRVADIVGARLAALGDRFQVFCITHLPQIAARGTAHVRIQKHVRRGRTVTSVEALDATGRVAEVARMIGGTAVTAAVELSAQDLLRAAASPSERRKAKAKVPWRNGT